MARKKISDFVVILLLISLTGNSSIILSQNNSLKSFSDVEENPFQDQLDSLSILSFKWKAERNTEKEIKALKEIGSIYQKLNVFDSAVFYYEKAAEIAIIEDFKDLYSSIEYNLGIVYSNLGLYPKALECGQKALETDIKIGKPENIAASLNGIAVIYQRWGMFDKALEYQLKSIKISEESGSKPEMANGYYNLGTIYQKLGKDDLALDNYNLAKEQFQSLIDNDSTQINLKQGLSETFYSVAGIYLKTGNWQKAFEEFTISLEIKKQTLDRVGISNIYNQLGSIFVMQQKYDVAIEYFKQAIQYKQMLNDKKGLSIAYFNIGNVYFRKKDYFKAEEYLNSSIEIAVAIGEKEVLKQAYLFLSNISEAKNSPKQALVYHKLYKAYADSVFNDNTSKVVEELSIKFETEKKEKENKILQLTVQKQKNFGFFLVGIILMVLTILIILYFQFRSKQKTNRIISHKNQLLGEQNLQINSQKIIIEQKNRDLTDSIVYAQRIQESLLSDIKTLNQTLPDAFIFLRPKDIVSGDFYWFSNKNGKFILSAIDCTGHGVPGAFMSMLGSSFLDQIVNNRGITSPDLILTELSSWVQAALKQSETKNQDGMDMALCSIDFNTKTVEFAGAKNPLVYVQKNEVFKLRADKFPIGRSTYEEAVFTKQVVQVDTPTCFYMFSDGYGDQFGGPDNKKFMSKRMCDMFLEIHQKPFDEQRTIVEKTITDWMNGHEQIDDILVVGFKVA